MTTALDLSLPTDQQLASTANPDPFGETARLTDTGNPGHIGQLARALTDSGTEMDGVNRRSQQSQQLLGGGFRNDGAPVYDEATHRAALPAGFRDAGSQLHGLGRRLGAVADELGGAIGDVGRSLDQLRSDLTAQRRAWQAEVDALGGPTGAIPAEAIAGMLARRATLIEQMQESVNSCGRTVAERIDRYNSVLRGCVQLLGEFRFPPAPRPGPDTRAVAPQPILQPDGSVAGATRPGTTPMTTIEPGGPAVEIFPRPEGGRFEGGHDHLPEPSGPSVLINEPAPPPQTQTDRGQLPGVGIPGIHVDASGNATPPNTSGAPTPVSPVAGARPHQGHFPRTAGPDETLVRRDGNGKVTSYQVYGPDGLPVKRVDVTGRSHGGVPTPHVVEFRRDVNPRTGEVFVNPNKTARPATPEEVNGL